MLFYESVNKRNGELLCGMVLAAHRLQERERERERERHSCPCSQMGTAGNASEQNWPIIQEADLEDLSSCAQLSTTLRTRGDYTHCITNS